MAVNLLDFYGPGWRIEQRYSPKVLIGNWYEERMRSDKGFSDLSYTPTPVDLIPYRGHQPDVTIRRKLSPSTSNQRHQNERMLDHDDGFKDEKPKISGNYGLKEQMEKKWRAVATGVGQGGLSSTYTVDYSEWPRKSYLHRMPELTRSTPDLFQRQTTSGSGTARCSVLTHHHDLNMKDPSYEPRIDTGRATSKYSRHMMAL